MAAPYPTSQSELTARVVALEAGLTALRQVLDERDQRYTQRAASQDAAVKSALDTSEKAITKAEVATEKRLEGLNELREMANDQSSLLLPRSEYSVQHQALIDRVVLIEKIISGISARGGGIKDAWAYLVGALGLLIAAGALYFHTH